jgi:hypothetical protein
MTVCSFSGAPLKTATGKMKAAFNSLPATVSEVFRQWKLLSCAVFPPAKENEPVPGNKRTTPQFLETDFLEASSEEIRKN